MKEVQKSIKSFIYLNKACCAFLLRQAKFGGEERKIFEDDAPNLLGKIGVIIKKINYKN